MIQAQQEQEIHTEYENIKNYRNEPDSKNYGTDHEIERAAVDKLSAYSIKQAKTQANVQSVGPN